VTITGVMEGTATITVTATSGAVEATQEFMVAVTAGALTAPSGVTATVDDSDPGTPTVTVTWTPGANADGGHLVLLFTRDFTELTGVATPSASDSTYTFTNASDGSAISSGSYVAVVVSIESRTEYLYDYATVTVP
jgi:hypothetical protein